MGWDVQGQDRIGQAAHDDRAGQGGKVQDRAVKYRAVIDGQGRQDRAHRAGQDAYGAGQDGAEQDNEDGTG